MQHLYTVMGLDVENIDEICEDIKYQYENGIATCALFKMALVPEGNPPVDKAKILCEKYAKFKEKLSVMGIPSGALVQASIGHGWTLGEMFPFQEYVGLYEVGERNVVCPYDDGFKNYIYNAMRTIASYSPDHIMVDDDFRLIGRPSHGCACPLHLKRFNELANTDFTRDELYDKLIVNKDESKNYDEIFWNTQKESLIETAKVMRAGIDSIDPKLPGSFCCVGNNAEFADEIAQILAGEGNPVIMRLNNGNYTPAGARFFSSVFFRAASQVAKVKDKVDFILAETDTCPQNRYSTGAMSVHTHFVGTILEGANGAKHWITRLTSHEPQSGVAYRKVLKKYSGFYSVLSDITPSLKWRGCRIPVGTKPYPEFGVEKNFGETYNGWGRCVLERLGLPMYFSEKNDGVLCLDTEVNLSDEEILEALKRPVFLASDSAQQLIKRGFGKYIGVDVREWHGKEAISEKVYVNGKHMSSQMKIKELVVTDESAVVDSMTYNTVDYEHFEPLFPGSVIFKNSLGGTVFTFAGSPNTDYNLIEAFSFLNYSRKEQLINMLRKTDELPAYFPGDEEVYLRVADMPDGGLFCAVFNLGLDPIEKLDMVFEKTISKIEKLLPDGTRKEISFMVDGDKYILDTECNTLDPVVIFVK